MQGFIACVGSLSYIFKIGPCCLACHVIPNLILSLQFTIFTWTILFNVSCTIGFLLGNECVAVPPCTCSTFAKSIGYSYDQNFFGVVCDQKNLTKVPAFSNTSQMMFQSMGIDLAVNSISNIPDRAFSNLQYYSNNVSVFLGSNNLTTGHVSERAFHGIEDVVVFLDLNRNHLTTIPKLVLRLKYLQGLDVQYNPIIQIDDIIMTSVYMYRYLKLLKISFGHMSAWPTALKMLRTLETLSIDKMHLSVPINAFVGFYGTLRHLKLTYVLSAQIPADICNLRKLETLDMEYNYGLAGDNLISCPTPLTSTTIIQLRWSDYKQFPNVFEYFPNLESLEFYGSNLRFINESRVIAGSKMKSLVCQSCKLQSIPGAVSMFSLLEYCGLSDNLIITVERYSFGDLPFLSEIHLEGNPIIYISRLAFRNIYALRTLVLWGTQITTVPQVIQILPNLEQLHLNNNMTCICGEPWMKKWASSLSKKPRFSVHGHCRASNETLHDFLFNSLPYCP